MSNYFLPTGTRIVIRDSKGSARWYETKKEVDVAELVDALCPIRTGVTVQTVNVEGFDLFFMNDQVRVRLDATEKARVKNMRFFKLEYDIPTGSALPDGHPATWLWRYAIRTTKSCWCVPEEQMSALYVRLNNLTEIGATWDATKYDATEGEKLFGQCVKALQRELAARTVGLQETLTSNAAKMDNVPAEATATDREKLRRQVLSAAEQIQKRHDEIVKNLTGAAGVFGINLRYLNLAAAANTAKQVRLGMRERARLFALAVEAVANSGHTDGAAVAASMQNGSLPADIAADFIEENVDETQGKNLREVFDLVSPEERDA